MQSSSDIKRSGGRNCVHMTAGPCFRARTVKKKFRCRAVHRKCTNRPQDFHIARNTATEVKLRRLIDLDGDMPAHYPVTLMHARRSAATLTLALLFAAFRAEAADDATLL